MIRPLEPRDVEAWAAMRHRLWPHADAGDLRDEAQTFVADATDSTIDAVFVAASDDAPAVGFIEVSIRDFADGCDSMPIPHVEGWYVEPSARHAGVGRDLMHAAEVWARDGGFIEIASDTEVENVDSQNAHQHCGFEETERLVKFRKALPPL